MEDKLQNLKKSMDNTILRGSHFTEQQKVSIRNAISQKERSDKTKIGKRKILYSLTGVACIFGILVGSSYLSPALASSLSQIPIIGSVFGNSDLIGLQQAQKKGLTSKVGETQTINGISVTLEEILYDQNNITIGLKVESEKELEDHYFESGLDFTINGDHPRTSSYSGTFREEIQSPTIRNAIQTISVTERMPSAFEIGLSLHGKNSETWYFSAPIKKINDINKIPIQHSEVVDGIHLTVTELSLSDTGVSISYESFEEGADFELSRAGNIEFIIVDQNGNEIKSYSGGGTGRIVEDGMVFESKKHFDPIVPMVTEITITPYLSLPTDGEGVEIVGGEHRKIELKGDSLQPVDFKPFKVNLAALNLNKPYSTPLFKNMNELKHN